MVSRATMPVEVKGTKKPPTVRATAVGKRPAQASPRLSQVAHALRGFHLLLRAHRLYDSTHPRVIESLDDAYDSLREISTELDGLDVRVERGGIVVPQLTEGRLPDARGEFHAFATDLQRAGIHTLYFSTKFHVGELDTLAQLIKSGLLRSEEPGKRLATGVWPNQLREHRVEGIQINTLTERKVDTVLASLIAALVAYGGNAPEQDSDAPIRAPQSEIGRASCRERV